MKAILLAMLTAITASPAVAQNQTPPPTTPPPPGGGRVFDWQQRMTADRMLWRFETDAYRLQQQRDLELMDPERVDVAREVTALMEAGECDFARDRARQEGERVMALRVRQLCQQVRRD